MSDITIILNKDEVVLDRVFAENIWELALGADSWENDYTDEDVYQKLIEYSEKANAWDTMYEEHLPNDIGEDTEEDYELREKMDRYYLEEDALIPYPNNLPRLMEGLKDE
jgi:ABC-type oligopeptide transport system substrate-binding subunit